MSSAETEVMMSDSKPVVVLGAGLAGLSSAWILSQHKKSVRLLEKEAYNGGLSITKDHQGWLYDLGPHNIHTKSSFFINYLQTHFPSLFRHYPTTRIFKKGKQIPYPIVGFRVLASLPVLKLPRAAIEFFLARVFMFIRGFRDEKSFKEWMIHRFGVTIYQEFFHHYPMKIWKLPTEEIDKYVAEKRIPVTSFVDLIKALLNKAYKVDHPEFNAKNFYLKNGIGELIHHFEYENREAGVAIENSVTIKGFEVKSDQITGVRYQTNDATDVVVEASSVLSTIPLNELVRLFPAVPDKVRNAAENLNFCSSRLLFLKVNKSQVFSCSLLYFSEPEVFFSRVSDVGNFSHSMVPANKCLLCFEFPCLMNDSVWNSTEKELADHAIAVFEKRDLIKRDEIEGFFSEKISHSYPQFSIGFEENLRIINDYLSQFKNFLSFGRQGGFEYINTDIVTLQGFQAASSVLGRENTGISLYDWFRGWQPSLRE